MDKDSARWGNLATWLRGQGVEVAEPLDATLIVGGRSNLTYRVTDARGQSFALRRPPLHNVLETAHDMGREYRIISALGAQSVPVPRARAYCPHSEILGAPFYVMDFVHGVVLAGHAAGATWPAELRPAASSNLVRALASIHAVDIENAGLGDLSRREDYLRRQLSRWYRQYSSSSTRDVPLMRELHRRLVAAAPPQRFISLVHGDYRFGNVMIGADAQVLAVLDWELATLGDPLADLGWLLATWHEPGEPEIFESPTGHPGFLAREEVVGLYQSATGRQVDNLDFYIGFALWRLACISEGIFARYRAGAMDDAEQDGGRYGELVYQLSEAAHQRLSAS